MGDGCPLGRRGFLPPFFVLQASVLFRVGDGVSFLYSRNNTNQQGSHASYSRWLVDGGLRSLLWEVGVLSAGFFFTTVPNYNGYASFWWWSSHPQKTKEGLNASRILSLSVVVRSVL